MKDVYNPDEDDVQEWLASGKDKWPTSDWDYYVMDGPNDLLVLQLANDLNCKQRLFFIHCLYYLVGDYFNSTKKDEPKRKRIENLLDQVDAATTPEVTAWRNETLSLLRGSLEFDSIYWLEHFIYGELKR